MPIKPISLFKRPLPRLPASRSYSFAQTSSSNDLRGIFPQLTTPFDKLRGEKIDWKHLENNLVQLNENKFAGLNNKTKYQKQPEVRLNPYFIKVMLLTDITAKIRTWASKKEPKSAKLPATWSVARRRLLLAQAPAVSCYATLAKSR